MEVLERAVRAVRASAVVSCPEFAALGRSDTSIRWGSAIDVNVSTNPLGARPHQDPRLVRAFAQAGFVWGGRFLRPDGMHFEYGCPSAYRIPKALPVTERLLRLSLCPPGR